MRSVAPLRPNRPAEGSDASDAAVTDRIPAEFYWPQGRRLTVKETIRFLDSFKGVTNEIPEHGQTDFLFSGEVFARVDTTRRRGAAITIATTLDKARALEVEYESVQSRPEGDCHWRVSVDLRGDIPDDILALLVIESYHHIRFEHPYLHGSGAMGAFVAGQKRRKK
ncbi:hypothetical protein [Frondihabitans peucedani]|uniref:Uncharacterized protein n=1 Tax=Frondihabitans peucedani TaxID=598626 RepID=A0ABP8E1E0_9MICO